MDTNCKLGIGLGTLLLVSACGGGGGGGATSTNNSYTGLTTPAPITTENGEEIATQAYSNGNPVDAFGGALASLHVPAAGTPPPTTLRLAQMLTPAVHDALQGIGAENSLAKHASSVTGEIEGDCGGAASYSVVADDEAGTFSGTLAFTGFCEDGNTITGSIGITGTLDQSREFETVSMTVSSLTLVTPQGAVTASGTLTSTSDGSTDTVTSTMVLANGITGRTFKTENLVITSTDTLSSKSLTMEGLVYHPEYGYVTLTTPTALVINSSDDYPSSGVLVATGAENGKVTLTALSETTYRIDIDTNGDDTLESTQTYTWEE